MVEKKIVGADFRATIALLVSIIAFIATVIALVRTTGKDSLHVQIRSLQSNNGKDGAKNVAADG